MATNGVIHTVEKVLEPVSQTLLDIVSSDPEMSYLKTGMLNVNVKCKCWI